MTYRYICKVGLYFVTEHLGETKTKFELRVRFMKALKILWKIKFEEGKILSSKICDTFVSPSTRYFV